MKVCIVSACLLGIPCRYDGRAVADLSEEFKRMNYLPVPVCPEQLSGLPTPRECCEIAGGDGFDVVSNKARVVTRTGNDITDYFIRGAELTYKICRTVGADVFFAKNFSPSCGVDMIYDGSFTGNKKKGAGVTSAYLKEKGIRVCCVDALGTLAENSNR